MPGVEGGEEKKEPQKKEPQQGIQTRGVPGIPQTLPCSQSVEPLDPRRCTSTCDGPDLHRQRSQQAECEPLDPRRSTEHHVTGRISTANAPMAGHDASGHKALLVRMYVLPSHSLTTAR